MAESWKVFRCSACGMCHGRKSVGHNCPHCGQRINESTPVVDKAANSTELRMKVLMANTPPELRESLAKKLSDSNTLINSNKSFNSAFGLRELRKLVDDRGNVDPLLFVVETILENFWDQLRDRSAVPLPQKLVHPINEISHAGRRFL
ncbi:MAG: hypothetical protein CMB29_00820, partial [Euryarchaeota archaeon]|nr:hypothetical protein [Euryarchaeota archaeon]